MKSSFPTTTLEGELERVTYFNTRNHYTIAKLKTSKTNSIVTIVGTMTAVKTGQFLKVEGTWETHPKYGQQFKIQSYKETLPATIDGIKKYLKSGIVKGIGPSTADRMIHHFKSEVFEIIERYPDRLLEVEGIGEVKAASICDAWKYNHAARNLMQLLQEADVKTSYCAKLLRQYGSNAVNIIRSDPYRLTADIHGIGFYPVDRIALKLGVSRDDPKRLMACVVHVMQQFVNEGHVFVYEEQLFEHCSRFLGLAADITRNAIKTLVDEKELVIENHLDFSEKRTICLREFYEAETGISDRVKALLSIPVIPPPIDSERISKEVQEKLSIALSGEQVDALEKILCHRVTIITGGPGTGKTTLIRSISAIFEALGKQVLLAAPTGRAARRLSEVTHRDAKTIHRLLGVNFQDATFLRNRDNPLDADAVIIDEASMIDTLLMFHLVNALPVTAVLILVGDVFQLPSIGPGNVLSDLIKSARTPVFYLKKIFRQAHQSPIILNAHRIRNGELPVFNPMDESDSLSEFYFLEQNDPGKVVSTIVELCTKTIPQNFSLDPLHDIQVLSPMHKGVVGTVHLNQVLQKALNPNPAAVETAGSTFKIGDKVMHLKNNYQKDVFNGDIGMISAVDPKGDNFSVDYYGRTVNYDSTETDEVSLAYAISVHKSQGSEYPAVILPLMTQHYVLLQRNLLYTAITRGKRLVILIGTKKAMTIALKNDTPKKRLSGLAFRLMRN
ncbi:MAG: ATP-dependent RecD-like DNA helicase [Desulfobacterales bacterium]